MESVYVTDIESIPSGYADALVRILVERGVEESRLLSGTGVTLDGLSDPSTRLSVEQLRRLSENAVSASPTPGLGLELGGRVHVARLGFLGYAMMSSETLQQALELASKYARLLSPFCSVSLLIEEDEAVVRIAPVPGLQGPVIARESVAACLVGQMRFILGRPIDLREVRFDFPRPGEGGTHERFFGCPVSFDCAHTELRFDVAELAAPVRFACAPSAHAAEAQCAQQAAPRPRGDIAERVAEALRERLEDPPDADGTARLMGMSKRSLARALQHRGTSFQQILDAVRKERALQCLTATALPVEEIAQQLGFSSGRAFRRAFRKWTGSAPSELRAN
ncbi:MAG: AraC family transcriptional regulator [Myxococcales bacterium]